MLVWVKASGPSLSTKPVSSSINWQLMLKFLHLTDGVESLTLSPPACTYKAAVRTPKALNSMYIIAIHIIIQVSRSFFTCFSMVGDNIPITYSPT